MVSRIGGIPVVWIVIGVIVAAVNGHFDSVDSANEFWALVLTVLAWPLPLFGFDIVVR